MGDEVRPSSRVLRAGGPQTGREGEAKEAGEAEMGGIPRRAAFQGCLALSLQRRRGQGPCSPPALGARAAGRSRREPKTAPNPSLGRSEAPIFFHT
jgi:hypothetical protein